MLGKVESHGRDTKVGDISERTQVLDFPTKGLSANELFLEFEGRERFVPIRKASTN